MFASLFTTSCKEIMSNLDQPVSSYLTVNDADVTIPLDEGTYQIETSTINSDKPITYKSSNPEVATVDAKGIVTPLIEGETEITVAVEASENYNAGEQKVKIAVKQPLTFEAKKDGQIEVRFGGFVTEKPVVYTINKGAKKELTTNAFIDVKKGDKVQFESANTTLTAGDGTWGVQIVPQQACAVYGDVMSMISPDGKYHLNKTITKDYAIKGLLCGTGLWDGPDCKELYTVGHEKYKLTLPATTLAKGCYSWLLAYTGLTEAPALPASEIPDNAYQEMFSNCYELTESPAIAAESLGEEACLRMFQNCAKLTKAGAITVEKTIGNYAFNYAFINCTELTESPAITAETIGEYACQNMFSGCQKLKKANAIKVKTAGNYAFQNLFANQPELTEAVAVNAETMGEWACNSMFYNCPKLTKVPATLPAMNLALRCYQSMFESCTSLTEAPVLPATDLKQYCYAYMFFSCAKLSYLKCLAKNTEYRSVYAMLWNAGTDESVTTRTLERDPDTFWSIISMGYVSSYSLYVNENWSITPPYEAASAPKAVQTPKLAKEVPVLNRSARHQVEESVSHRNPLKPEVPAMFKK